VVGFSGKEVAAHTDDLVERLVRLSTALALAEDAIAPGCASAREIARARRIARECRKFVDVIIELRDDRLV